MSGICLKSELFASLPPEWPEEFSLKIRDAITVTSRKLVVLDDDPTGTQTVRDVPVLTTWDIETLRTELASDFPCFYILSNTRAFPKKQAEAINREIGKNLTLAACQNGRPKDFIIISRSDSTLRGHFPAELNALTSALSPEAEALPTLLIPYFEAGGRFTIHDTHYVAEGDELTPAAKTPFAKDAAFGYKNSHLPSWVEEMTAGAIKADSVSRITIDDIRLGGPDAVLKRLTSLPPKSVCIANAACPRDLEVIAWATLQAENLGHPMLYRTAASFVAARLGQNANTLWNPPVSNAFQGGLTVVGSYVPKTTAQLEILLNDPSLSTLELSVDAILSPTTRSAELERATHFIEQSLAHGHDTVIYTSRKLHSSDDATSSLAIGNQVSAALVELVKSLTTAPRYLIAKGGITSSDLATQALGVKRAMVLGQIIPGVPVWSLGPETRFPQIPYIVFPGNVGGTDALLHVVKKLNHSS